jgi:hypothetical protein
VFDNKFILKGMEIKKVTDGLRIEIIWQSNRKQVLEYNVAIHLLDKEGNIN